MFFNENKILKDLNDLGVKNCLWNSDLGTSKPSICALESQWKSKQNKTIYNWLLSKNLLPVDPSKLHH